MLAHTAAGVRPSPSEAFTIDESSVRFGGNGCSARNAQAIVSPDGRSLSVLFDDLRVDTEGNSRRGQATCNMHIPIRVPAGQSIGLYEVDYRGFAYVPEEMDGASASFSADYDWSGRKGPTRETSFGPGFDDDFTISDSVQRESIVWSPCGRPTLFKVQSRIDASEAARGSARYDDFIEVALDTADFRGRQLEGNALVSAKFQVRQC
eukprot:jgi/Tetstr1/463118/TSEL_008052.t1